MVVDVAGSVGGRHDVALLCDVEDTCQCSSFVVAMSLGRLASWLKRPSQVTLVMAQLLE